MYKKLEAFIGKTYLPDIIEFKYEMDLNGYYKLPEDAPINKNPFYGIGMVEFRNRFDEIMEWFLKKKKNKTALYDNIMENKDKVFASNIPVYSAVLRQVFLTEEDYSYTKIDKKYNSLMANIISFWLSNFSSKYFKLSSLHFEPLFSILLLQLQYLLIK